MSRAVPALVLGVLLGVVPALPGPAGAVAVDQTYAMPGTGAVTIRGHGYGHGHGMSQYGAEGAAAAGQDLAGDPEVLLPRHRAGHQAAAGSRCSSQRRHLPRRHRGAARSGLRVRDTGTGKDWALPENGATRWRLEVAGGQSVVDYKTDRWHRWMTLAGDGAFTPAASRSRLYLAGPAGRTAASSGRPVRARLERPRHGQLAARWTPTSRASSRSRCRRSWKPNAVRAQAVAARTYAAYEMQHPRGRALPDLRHHLVPGVRRLHAEHDRSNAAVDATAGGDPDLERDCRRSRSSARAAAAGPRPNQFAYLPAKAGPLRRVGGQPGAHLDGQGRRRADRAGLARRRQPEVDRGHPARRQRRVAGPGLAAQARRRQGRQAHGRHRLRRHLPLHAGPALHLVHLRC